MPLGAVALIGLGRIPGHRDPQRVTFPGNRIAAGITPTMVCGTPFSLSARPSTSGEAAKRSRHRLSPITTTRSAFGRSSSGVKVRPRSGRTPSTAAKSCVTTAPSMRSAPAPSERLKLSPS